MYTGDIEQQLREKFGRVLPFFNEKLRRLMAASEAIALGYGGIAMVSRATGLSEPAIRAGLAELAQPETIVPDRVRRRSRTTRDSRFTSVTSHLARASGM